MNKKEGLKRQRLSGWLSAGILLTGSLVILLIFGSSTAYADAEVTVTGEDWYIDITDYGAVTQTGVEPDTHAGWTITGSSTGKEDIDIKVSADSDWSASATGGSGIDEFGLIATSASGHVITGSDTTLLNLRKDATHNLKLKYTAPAVDSVLGAHTLTVTLTATNFFAYDRVFVLPLPAIHGNMGGLNGADAKCQAAADDQNFTGTFKAFLSSSTVHAKDRVTNQAYYLVNVTKVCDNKIDLLDGILDNKINYDAAGVPKSGHSYTCTHSDGTSAYGDAGDTCCNNWTNNTTSYSAHYGSTTVSDLGWTWIGIKTCNNTSYIYCFEL